jgi:hypothetical protein
VTTKQKVDLSELLKYSMRSKKAPCKLGLELDQLSDADRAVIEAGLEDKRISNGAIVEFFTVREIPGVSVGAITSHKGRTCTCAYS